MGSAEVTAESAPHEQEAVRVGIWHPGLQRGASSDARQPGGPTRERRRSRLKRVRLRRVLGKTVLDVGSQLTLA
jgi:hypothetical protein